VFLNQSYSAFRELAMTIVAAQTTAAPSTQTRTTLPRRLRCVVFVVGVSVSFNFALSVVRPVNCACQGSNKTVIYVTEMNSPSPADAIPAEI